jgi:hypothetical protein
MTRRPLAVGDVIHGHASGAFGRDHEGCVRIEAVGPDWIVAGDPSERRWRSPSFASGRKALELCQEARDATCYECPLAEYDPPLTTWKAQP